MSFTSLNELLAYRDGIYASDLLICAVAHFDSFSVLDQSPRSLDELCAELQIAHRPADVMLSLFLARHLISKNGSRHSLTQAARDYLVKGARHSLVPYYASLGSRRQCLEFVDVLKNDRPAGWSSKKQGQRWLDAMKHVNFADTFTAAMHSRGASLASELVKHLDCSSYGSLLDIGGASGVYACTFAAMHPTLAATVLEIEPVDRAARRFIAAQGMSDRVDVIAGDMFKALPSGYDVHLFANVFHDWDLDSIRTLVNASFSALNSGVMIAVLDAHLNEEKDGPLTVAEYSCLVMHATPGRCYSTTEIERVLVAEGFANIQVQDVAASRSVITATKQ